MQVKTTCEELRRNRGTPGEKLVPKKGHFFAFAGKRFYPLPAFFKKKALFLLKGRIFLHFSCNLFAYMKKKQYL